MPTTWSRRPTTWSRRQVLIGGSAALLAVACGGPSSEAAPFSALVNRFADGTLTPGRQRMPVVLGTADGVADRGPDVLTGTVQTMDGQPVASKLSAPRHDQGVPTPYWPFRLELTAPGLYQLAVPVSGSTLTTAFTISDPGQVLMPK